MRCKHHTCIARDGGGAKAAFLCSCCCSCHLWFHDRGRLGRATLRVGARLKEGEGEGREKNTLNSPSLSPPPPPLPFTRPISSSLLEFQHGTFVTKTFVRPKKTPALEANSLHKNKIFPGYVAMVFKSSSTIMLCSIKSPLCPLVVHEQKCSSPAC